MIAVIENEFLKAEINTMGAEIRSLICKSSGLNYLWCADKAVWGKVSPVLFPVIGKMREGKIVAENSTYEISNHGFIRDTEFCISAHDSDCLTLYTVSSPDTKAMYPYEFTFSLTYRLLGHTLSVCVKIENTDDKTIYFAYGGHTGFSTETAGATMTDYTLEFDRSCEFVTELFNDERKQLTGEKKSLGKGRTIDLSPELFKDDALIFSNIKSKSVRLKNRRTGLVVLFDYPSFPNLAIWSPLNCSRFVCIEPWFGITDSVDSPFNIEAKKSYVSLNKKKAFTAEFAITIHTLEKIGKL